MAGYSGPDLDVLASKVGVCAFHLARGLRILEEGDEIFLDRRWRRRTLKVSVLCHTLVFACSIGGTAANGRT